MAIESVIRRSRACWRRVAAHLGAWLAAGLCCLPAAAQLAPPPAGPTLSSAEWASQAPAPGGMFAYRAHLRGELAARRFDVLQAHFESLWESMRKGEIDDAMLSMRLDALTGVDESHAALFDAWVAAHPGSAIPALARGYFHLNRAWKARGNKYARETGEREFAEMHRWLDLARRDAQLALGHEPACALCYRLLISISMPGNLPGKEVVQWFTAGLRANADSLVVPTTYYRSLDERWGGSEDQQRALMERLELAGHQAAAMRLRAIHMVEDIDCSNWTPAQAQEGLGVAQRSIELSDNYRARVVAGCALRAMDRHAEAVEALTHLIHTYEVDRYVFDHRAHSLMELGRWPEAMRDLRISLEEFDSPWALEILVRLSAGNSGRAFRTSPAEYPGLCKQGAMKGMPVAMLCLGGLHFFGQGGVSKDLAQARTWFERAANAGNAQAMMDLAHMATLGQGGAVDRGLAIRMWLAAAERKHPQAQAKIDALTFSERLRYVYWPRWSQDAGGIWQVVRAVLGSLIFGR